MKLPSCKVVYALQFWFGDSGVVKLYVWISFHVLAIST